MNREKLIKRVNFLLALLLGMYLLYAGVYYTRQDIMLYPGVGREAPPDTFGAWDIREIRIPVEGGAITAWYLPPIKLVTVDGPAPMAVWAHGNNSLKQFWVHRVRGLRELGFGVLLPEYPGFAGGPGDPGQRSITRAVVAAYDSAVARGWADTSRVLIGGHSLGSGVACQLALVRPSQALLLAAPFVNVPIMAARYALPAFLVRDRWDNRAALRRYRRPVLVVHGTADEVIPFGHGSTLYKVAERGAIVVGQGNHDYPVGPWQELWPATVPFLSAAGLIEGGGLKRLPLGLGEATSKASKSEQDE